MSMMQLQRIHASSFEGSLPGSLDDNFEQFSLILFTLDRNTVRVEKYTLDEFAPEMNRVSKQSSRTHCFYKLRLGEQGEKVNNIAWNFSDIDNLIVETSRSSKKIYYALNWRTLVAQAGFTAQDYMRAEANIQEVYNVTSEGSNAVDWFSSLEVKWGLPTFELRINLRLERRVQAAAAVIVPNYVLEADLYDCNELKRAELFTLGILKKIK